MTAHSLIVSCLLLLIGGVLLTLNIREAIERRDAKQVATAETALPTEAKDRVDQPGPGAQETTPGPTGGVPVPSGSAGSPIVNQIPRVRVAGLAMPLGVGVLLLIGTMVTWVTKSDQAVQVTATLAGVAGILMLLLGLEHLGSLLNWGADPLGPSALVLLTSGLLCLSLPGRWWWSRTNEDSSSSS